jgi:hypothetical protein
LICHIVIVTTGSRKSRLRTPKIYSNRFYSAQDLPKKGLKGAHEPYMVLLPKGFHIRSYLWRREERDQKAYPFPNMTGILERLLETSERYLGRGSSSGETHTKCVSTRILRTVRKLTLFSTRHWTEDVYMNTSGFCYRRFHSA